MSRPEHRGTPAILCAGLTKVYDGAVTALDRLDLSSFVGTSAEGMGAVAVVGTAIMLRHSIGARAYLVLARVESPAVYSRGLMLATALLRGPLLLLLLLLALASNRITDPTPAPLALGALAILSTSVLVAVVTVALSNLIVGRGTRILFLLWLFLALLSLDSATLAGWPSPLVELLAVLRTPLQPLFAVVDMGSAGAVTVSSVVAALAEVSYLLALVRFSGSRIERRELILH